MRPTTVVFVHGFHSTPMCWEPFLSRLRTDSDLAGCSFLCFTYPTAILELNPAKRIPVIAECGNSLGAFLETQAPPGPLLLVGHSMGGLVIQSFLAQKLRAGRARDLARIRSVVLFATPNRGSITLGTMRSIFSTLFESPQEQDLQVLNRDIWETSEEIGRGVLAARGTDDTHCPIPFRVFWGLQDNIVPEASARGPFEEASGLPGGHGEVIRCDPKDPGDVRYLALKDALLHPVGHTAVYEIDFFEVILSVSPSSIETPVVLRDLAEPLTIHADNVALRLVRIAFAKENRCRLPFDQTYRSDKGFVELLGLTEPNEAPPEALSEYYSTGKKLTYVFTPDKGGTFCMKVRIYNGFGEGERGWHNHMKPNAHCRLFRLRLNLQDYRAAGYALSREPALYYHDQNILDHKLCLDRIFESPLPAMPSPDAWSRTWEIADVTGGVVDLVWDVSKSG